MKRAVLPFAVAMPLLIVVVAALFFASFLLGRFPISPVQVLAILASKIFPVHPTWPVTMEMVVFGIRLPRIAAALLVGGALASSGAAYQSLFKNPLVSPAILGVSSGASLGAAAAMLLSFSWFAIQATAFACGLAAVLCTLAIGKVIRGGSLVMMVLAGLVVSAFCEAFVSMAKYVADPLDKLPAITFWLLGGLGRAGQRDVALLCIPVAFSFVVLFALRAQVNALALGEEEALTLGVDAARVRLIVILVTTLMAASAVSVCGVIGWIGLLIPHIARMLVGPNFQVVLPTSLLLGGGFLLLVDDLVRSLHVEFPLGILTAMIGAPFFVFVLIRVRRAWE